MTACVICGGESLPGRTMGIRLHATSTLNGPYPHKHLASLAEADGCYRCGEPVAAVEVVDADGLEWRMPICARHLSDEEPTPGPTSWQARRDGYLKEERQRITKAIAPQMAELMTFEFTGHVSDAGTLARIKVALSQAIRAALHTEDDL